MKLTEFIDAMERIAPASLAWERDNVGLLIGTRKAEIHRVLVALECTAAVAVEAAEWGADLVLTHHPLFFHPVRCIDPYHPDTAAAYILIEHGIGLFAAHTNLDAAHGGVNDVLCARLGLTEVHTVPEDSLLRLGVLRPPMTLSQLAHRCENDLAAHAQICGDPDRLLVSAAVIGGAGGEEIPLVKALGADVMITGEARHHEALTAMELDLPLLVLGHYETENAVLEPLISRLQSEGIDVQYKITHRGRAPFARP